MTGAAIAEFVDTIRMQSCILLKLQPVKKKGKNLQANRMFKFKGCSPVQTDSVNPLLIPSVPS